MKDVVRRTALLALLLGVALSSAGCEKERTAYALTSTGKILGFDTGKPTKIDSEVSVSGLGSGESLVQIDYRPASASYYCVTNKARLCTVDPKTGAASLVSATALVDDTLDNPVIDFSPAADLLRVIAGERNLRVNPSDGRVAADTPVDYDGDDVNDGRAPRLAAVAYDRNRSDATSATLFGLDVTTQSLVRVGSKNGSPNSPNGGRLFTIAPLSVAFTSNAGFDIEPDGDVAYAVLAGGGMGAALYRVDLSTGLADRVDAIDDGDRTIISLAIGPEETTQ